MKTRVLAVPLLLVALAGCGSDTPGGSGTASPSPTPASQRWKALTEGEKDLVCQAMESTPAPVATDMGSGQLPASGPNYQAMLTVLIEAGLSQPDAAAMLPYAANACT